MSLDGKVFQSPSGEKFVPCLSTILQCFVEELETLIRTRSPVPTLRYRNRQFEDGDLLRKLFGFQPIVPGFFTLASLLIFVFQKYTKDFIEAGSFYVSPGQLIMVS